MRIIKKCATSLLLIASLLSSCHKNNNPYGLRITEELKSMNIIEDNYRNWYEIYVGSFYDSNSDKQGDLQGVIEKLDYIKDLGFNGIWLMPINKSTSYHKYDVLDYYEIDSSYGSMNDLENLISECHKRDIKLILDLVLNHSSLNHPLFSKSVAAHQKYISGLTLTAEEEKYKDYYSFYDGDVPPSGYVKVPNHDFYYEANFSNDMPEYNCDNPYVREEFQNIINFYLDKGVDGFRLDAVKYYYLDSKAKNIELLSKINEWVKAKNKDAYIVGECWETSASTLSEYYASGIDSFFNFSCSVSAPSSYLINSLNLDGKMLNTYYSGLLSNIKIASSHIPAPFLDNHDMPRYTSTGNIKRSKFQYALLQMLNGSTFTYYGDEVGMVGTNTGSSPDQDVRIPIKWGEDKGDCKPPVGTSKTNYVYKDVKTQMNDKSSIYNYYKKVLLIRNQNPEISRGSPSLLLQDRDNKILAIKKTYQNSEIGIIFNFSPTNDLTFDISEYNFTKVVGQITDNEDYENKYIGQIDDKIIKLPPYSIVILK